MNDRGEYRPMFEALLDGPQFQALSKWARALFYPVKLRLGALGIRAIPGAVAVFQEATALEWDEVERARDELCTRQWLRIDGTVWWLVRGLEFEPQLESGNKNHRIFVYRHTAALPNRPIRAEFVATYRHWFDDDKAEAIGRPSEGPSKGMPYAPPITAPTPAPAPILPQKTAATAGARELELFAKRFTEPGDLDALAEFLERVPDPVERHRWARKLLGYLDGMDMPDGKRATPAGVVTACRDFSGDPNPARFRRFVERAMVDQANPIVARAKVGDLEPGEFARLGAELDAKASA